MNQSIPHLIRSFSDDTRRVLKDNLVATYLFGSTARNQADEFSDIDLLIIVRHYDYQIRRELSRLASKYSISHGVCFSPVVKDLATWERNRSHDTLFYREINHDGVRI